MIERRSVRSQALRKLALLSSSSSSSSSPSDFVKLCDSCEHPQEVANGTSNGLSNGAMKIGQVPMGFRELEVLLALCNAAHSLDNIDSARRFVQQASFYLSESCVQALAPSPFLKSLHPSPWEVLTTSLADALLKVGIRHLSLRGQVSASISDYIRNCSFISLQISKQQPHGGAGGLGSKELLNILTLTSSMVGFLEASSRNIGFWDAEDRHELLSTFQKILSDDILVATEAAVSIIRNSRSSTSPHREWKQYLRHYVTAGKPLGAMLLRERFLQVVEACASLMIAPPFALQKSDALSVLLSRPKGHKKNKPALDDAMAGTIAEIVTQQFHSLEEGADYLQIGSAWQQRIAHSVKASCFKSFLFCAIATEDEADLDLLISWLDTALLDPIQVADETLVCSVLKCMAALADVSSSFASKLSRSMPNFFTQGPLPLKVSTVAAECLLFVLQRSPQDTVITTLYGLGNSLSARRGGESHADYTLFNDVALDGHANPGPNGDIGPQSAVSLALTEPDGSPNIYGNVIQAIVIVAKGFRDEKIVALSLSMLVQKVGKVSVPVDLKIITDAATLAVNSAPAEFRALLRLYQRLSLDGLAERDERLQIAVSEAREYLSKTLKGGSPLYGIYLTHLLETIVTKGDTRQTDNGNAETAAQGISLLLRPLALLVACNVTTLGIEEVDSYPSLQRDAWYNIVVHGFSTTSSLGKAHLQELKILAKYSNPIIAEEHADRLESDIELNIVLRRGKESRNTADLRRELAEALPRCESNIKDLDYQELIFLKAANLVETLRAVSGDCTRILAYFVDPQLKNSAIGNCMAGVAIDAVDLLLERTLQGQNEVFSAPYVAQQLSTFFQGCCHRVERVQQVAYTCAERIIAQTPSALCQRVSIFALLDLLNIMWASCLEAETEEYEWKSTYTAPSGTTVVHLSDDYDFRRFTLKTLHKHAKNWVMRAINVAPLDIKGLLQTYLSEYGDDEAFGHMSLGSSFALEMGAAIPMTDQRLGAIETETDLNVNTAADFMSSYTTRQEYRFTDPLRVGESTDSSLGLTPVSKSKSDRGTNGLVKTLADLESRVRNHEPVRLEELREPLRRAASLLCRSKHDHTAVIAHFVRIPYGIFTKHSVKLGLSLWMGVIKENPRMEPRLLFEITEGWISTVNARLGIFNNRMRHADPFYLKEEFAPSDRESIVAYQQRAHDLIAPHFRLLQFLSSHYSATRLSSPSVEKAYHRLLKATLPSLRRTTSHPLGREVHFHIVLLGLKVLRYSTSLSQNAKWRLSDEILSAGLAWFSNAPRWSYGGNRLQVKAETHLLADVTQALQYIEDVHPNNSLSTRHLHMKQQLLQILLANEQTRLMVWLFPLDHSRRHHFTSSQDRATGTALPGLLGLAWEENPDIVINLVKRFQSETLFNSIRNLLLQQPDKGLRDAEALSVLLGSSLPVDVSFHLKYLLYWASVNPITAVTYFLPAYANHPYIIQYAVRALESHSVDITFFYVPQIVQTLRYDNLGYIERYIIETAKFSQIFAHQIIWNMKANAYKDDESQVPDPVKPTLDKVTNSLFASFSKADKDFYDREFTFFDEITDISGKLRPYIKKSKPEKKQKIEEELRKIQVDVGVYLPSNPDGVVVGIDRKSGKPLQSHAKAPYMATFRIRKEHTAETVDLDDPQTAITERGKSPTMPQPQTYEVWQSAIFKVGDDCRQDILALQMIAAFRGIFAHVGLPVYVFPYRVTATAPGCGVIDVLPNSISRDMLGREAVNGLYDWFVSNFGGEDSVDFMRARANFVKSLAAYSIISYLLQFKDRHNGNIMLDEEGHILHIDFGFCFDIAPGGVKFERSPFKLTKEMVAVMGGSPNTQSFRWFEELCVKSFLASRPYFESLKNIIVCMLDSGLPCFKPETIDNFRGRFVLDKGERDAAEFVRGLVRKSFESFSTKSYDWFQWETNSIPY